ncbi:MAG: fibronectin type III domain-containing protein, partial [Eubacterium sp.]
TSISSVSAGSKKFTVKWKKQSTQVTGYQIQYSTSSKFTSPKTVTVSSYKTTSKTISKLKSKKKYYVRVRTYKTVGKTKYYSSWSKAKSITTKK